MKFDGFIGPSYTLDSVNVAAQRCVNVYPEMIEGGVGKEGQVAYLKSTPGLDLLFEIGDGPIRLVYPYSYHNMTNPTFLVVSGNRLYSAEFDGSSWSTREITNTGTYNRAFANSSGRISAATALVTVGPDIFSYTIFVDGTSSYAVKINTNNPSMTGFEFGLYSDYFTIAGPTNASQVLAIDGYYIFNQLNSNSFLVSDYLSLNVNALSFASAEGDPDNIVGILANTRYLVLFNERTTEVWANTGNPDFPFERISGGFIEKGCLAPLSIAKIDSMSFWLGRDAYGQGQVFAMQGLTPQRISTHAIEQAISKYSDPSLATAYTYQKNGHSFYVINFAEATWVYDLSTKLWHERAYTNKGQLERHRVDIIGFIPEANIHVCGDYETRKVYKFNDDTYSDAGTEITRLRSFPHVSSGSNNVFHKELHIDVEGGVGLVNDLAQGYDPVCMLRFSDDGGHTWSNERQASLGKLGKYKNRVRFHRLGASRDRVYEIKITDPVKVTFVGADITIEQGAS